MTTPRIPSWTEVGVACAIATATTAAGSGISAAIRGGKVKQSASVVGLGSGSVIAAFGVAAKLGLFGRPPKTTPKLPKKLPKMHVLALYAAFLEPVGTSVGYLGSKLFTNSAVSTAPFKDAALGLPITIGLMYWLGLLQDYYDQNQNAQDEKLKSHTL